MSTSSTSIRSASPGSAPHPDRTGHGVGLLELLVRERLARREAAEDRIARLEGDHRPGIDLNRRRYGRVERHLQVLCADNHRAR
jgi:hypothetical protein